MSQVSSIIRTSTAVTRNAVIGALAIASGARLGAQVTADFPRDSNEPTLMFLSADVIKMNRVEVTDERLTYQMPRSSSATKTDTALRDVPQSLSVVTHEQIADQQIRSISDLIRYVPGVQSHQGENNRDQVVLRGNSSSADFFVNGVRDDVQYYRDLYNIERVEVLKGPNALIFGRGGGGGAVNRVTKQADFTPFHELSLMFGSYGNARAALDYNQPLTDSVAARINLMYESADSFRSYVHLERLGVAPTVTFTVNPSTSWVVGYEHLRDVRTSDRGVSSYRGRPVDLPISTYYGNPRDGFVHADVDLLSSIFSKKWENLSFQNKTLLGHYNRGYQNQVPGVTSDDGKTVRLSAYNNATTRQNLFNQSEFVSHVSTGWIRHTVLFGAEGGVAGYATPCFSGPRAVCNAPTISVTRVISTTPTPRFRYRFQTR